MFIMSFLEIPKGVLKEVDYYWSIFFGKENNDKQKYHLAKWDNLFVVRKIKWYGSN